MIERKGKKKGDCILSRTWKGIYKRSYIYELYETGKQSRHDH